MIRALFLCTHNRRRSPTAEQVFAQRPGVDTDSAGLGHDADVLLTAEQIDWATVIFVMERKHRSKLSQQFRAHLNGKKVVCLDIPDDYGYLQDELVTLLERKVTPYL
ncbi:low molecular weight protein tyrosine phosphatase family protein [Chitinolyticbacter meiyuanensis]|uniref:low molecular weight protein tyrosine phosphatase family protein n=1 Tax=Chitinolyticbacter meiyuanensis TaxID=682798 RepID=UPI0011E5D5C5|nr:low molecular weight protein tyrosine phosphatase family protein [Chitinolyticbacter meiyuanensis]